MKIGELTLGDFVSMNGKPVKVCGIYSAGIHYQDGDRATFASSETLEGLLITPEFLAKNEFSENDGVYEMTWCENYYVTAVKIKDNLWTIHIQGDSANLDGGVRYIHELQNALKVCEIGKKIVL